MGKMAALRKSHAQLPANFRLLGQQTCRWHGRLPGFYCKNLVLGDGLEYEKR